MTATNIQPDSRQILGGDRFYTAVRMAILLVLLVVGVRLAELKFWPPLQQGTPAVLVWWAYAIFGVMMIVAVLLPRLSGILPWSVLIDFGFLALLTVLIGSSGGVRPEMFYPLYLLPAISGALRRRPLNGLGAGLVAALCYVIAVVMAHQRDQGPMDSVTMLGLGLNSTTLVLVGLLTGTLAERWSAAKWALVDEARMETQRALQDAESYRERMRSLYEVAYALGSTSTYETVLETALTEIQRLVNGQTSLALLSTGEPNEVYVVAGRGLRENDLHQRVRTTSEGAIGQTLRSGEARLVADASKEEELTPIAAMQRCHAACAVPLTAGRRTYGVILVASAHETPYTEEQFGMIETLAKYAILALLNAQLIQELREERAKLISREEEVRQQLNRDLHDGPAQALAALTMNIEFVRRLLERDPQRVSPELEKMRELAQRTTKQVRTLLFELRPLALDSQGLIATLEEYLGRLKDQSTQIVFDNSGDSIQLDSKRQATIFNIIQESVNNALKHAQAQHIWVRLRTENGMLMATVQDDGRGFDLAGTRNSYNQRGSFGLLNIEERARLVGGTAEMHSAPGTGTTVRVMVPIEDGI